MLENINKHDMQWQKYGFDKIMAFTSVYWYVLLYTAILSGNYFPDVW